MNYLLAVLIFIDVIANSISTNIRFNAETSAVFADRLAISDNQHRFTEKNIQEFDTRIQQNFEYARAKLPYKNAYGEGLFFSMNAMVVGDTKMRDGDEVIIDFLHINNYEFSLDELETTREDNLSYVDEVTGSSENRDAVLSHMISTFFESVWETDEVRSAVGRRRASKVLVGTYTFWGQYPGEGLNVFVAVTGYIELTRL